MFAQSESLFHVIGCATTDRLFRGRWSARQDHSFQQVKSIPCQTFVLHDAKVPDQVMMPDVRGDAITVLVHEPLTRERSGGVSDTWSLVETYYLFISE